MAFTSGVDNAAAAALNAVDGPLGPTQRHISLGFDQLKIETTGSHFTGAGGTGTPAQVDVSSPTNWIEGTATGDPNGGRGPNARPGESGVRTYADAAAAVMGTGAYAAANGAPQPLPSVRTWKHHAPPYVGNQPVARQPNLAPGQALPRGLMRPEAFMATRPGKALAVRDRCCKHPSLRKSSG